MTPITNARVNYVPSNGSLEKAGTAITTVNSVVLPVRFVTTHLASHRDWKCSSCGANEDL